MSASHTARRAGESANEKIVVRRYTVDICDPCMKLEGSECHTPECIFFLCGMKEVGAFLDRSLIRPVIDGERIENLQKDAPVTAPWDLVNPHKLGFCCRFASNQTCMGCGDATNGDPLP